MIPARYDLTIWRGIDFGPILFRFQDENGDPIDMRGWQAFAAGRKIDLNPVFTNVGPDYNEWSVSKTKDQTILFAVGQEKWDWILQIPGGVRIGPVMKGTLSIKETVTQPGTVPPSVPGPSPPLV